MCRSAEEKAEKAETLRRAADRRAASAEAEAAALRVRLDEAERAIETARGELEEEKKKTKIARATANDSAQQAREEAQAMARKISVDSEADKKALQDQVDKISLDLAKRTQTLLAVQVWTSCHELSLISLPLTSGI